MLIMFRRLFVPNRVFFRAYCSTKTKDIKSEVPRIDFKEIKHQTKVPLQPEINNKFTDTTEKVEIDNSTIQLLERLSLVDLDSKEALKTLQDSIQFADKIVGIDTSGVEPLYTPLEDYPLDLREDQVTDGNIKDDILKNAKVIEEDYFVAPPGNIPLEQEDKKFD